MGDGLLEGDDLRMWRAFLHWSEGIHASVGQAVTRAADLSVPEFEVLVRLWDAAPEFVVEQGDLVVGLGWSASRASHLLRRLEERGFVDRADVGTGRRRTVRLSQRGHEQLLRAFDAHGAEFRRVLLDRLSVDQRAALLSIMTSGE